MKHVFLHKALGLILTLLVIVSGMSFNVEKHYCKQTLTTQCSCSEDKTICTVEQDNCCTDSSDNTDTIKSCNTDCCVTVSRFVKGIEILQQAVEKQKLTVQLLFVLPVAQNSIHNYWCLPQQLSGQKLLRPPNNFKSFTILFQVFRI